MAILCALAFLVIRYKRRYSLVTSLRLARSLLRFCGAAVLRGNIVWFARDLGLVLDPLGSDCQRRGSRDQYHNKLRCDYAGLAEWQRLGINCIALFAVARWDLSPRDWRNGRR